MASSGEVSTGRLAHFEVTVTVTPLLATFVSVCGDVRLTDAPFTTCCAVPGARTVSAIVVEAPFTRSASVQLTVWPTAVQEDPGGADMPTKASEDGKVSET